MQSIVDYLRAAESNSNKKHVEEIRDRYRQVLQLVPDADLPENVNEGAIEQVAQQLNLRMDTDEARDYLRQCVSYGDIEDAVAIIFQKLAGEEAPMVVPEPLVLPESTRMKQNFSPTTTMITEIDCLLIVKMVTKEVDQFIERFLLQDAQVALKTLTR